MHLTVQFNTTNFNRALAQYLVVSSKEVSDALNKKAGDLAMYASKFAPKANRANISGLEEKAWWPRLISKMVRMGIAKIHSRQRVKAGSKDAEVSWIDNATGETRFGRKSKGVTKTLTRTWDSGPLRRKEHNELTRFSRQLIRRRISTINAMKATFGVVALKFGKPMGAFERKGRTFELPTKLATPRDLWARFVIKFRSKREEWPGGTRPNAQQDVQQKRLIAMKALNAAQKYVIADMHKYINAKLQKANKQVFGRAA